MVQDNNEASNSPHNRTHSVGIHAPVGGDRAMVDDPSAQGQFRWTERLRADLLMCYHDSDPQSRGYMARMHALWCDMHPEHCHLTQKHLRNYAVWLKNRRRSIHIERRQSQRLSFPAPVHQQEQRISLNNQTDFRARQAVNKNFHYSKVQLEAINRDLAERAPEDIDLLSLNWAVYDAALSLMPTEEDRSPTPEAKMKKRIEQLHARIVEERKHVSRIECVKNFVQAGKAFTPKVRAIVRNIKRQHHTLNMRILMNVREHALERIRALVTIKKSLKKRLKRLIDNNCYRSNPSRFLQPQMHVTANPPTIQQVETFWSELYGESPVVDRDTPALALFETYCNQHQRQNLEEECQPVTAEEVAGALKDAKNWAAPGPDGINAYWWKKLTSTHHHLARIFTSYLQGATTIPRWLVEGRTVLIPKSGDLSDPKNYRPITCLNSLYKTFTKILNARILQEIEPVWSQIYEQRGSKRGLAGCKENLLVDRCVTQDAIQYKRSLSMAWVDYRKAFDTTSHELILFLLKCLRVNPHIVRCIQDLMPLWQTRFHITHGNEKIVTRAVQFHKGVFQGDSLSPLLFCISLLPISVILRMTRGYLAGPPNNRRHQITHLFYMDDLKIYAPSEEILTISLQIVERYTRDVGMSFGLDKCAVVHLKKGRYAESGEDVELQDGSVLRQLGAGETYKYLGMAENIMQDVSAIKESLRSEYKWRLQKIWSSELSGPNKVSATNSLAVPVLLYSFGVVKWRREELRQLDITTRKRMTIHRSHHPRSSVPRLYLPRQLGGRGLLSLECLHDRLVIGVTIEVAARRDPLMEFVQEHEANQIGSFLYKAATMAVEILGLRFRDLRAAMPPDRKRMIRAAEQNILLEQHRIKPMHGVFYRHIQEHGLSEQLTFSFLRSAGLMSETEGFIFACQDGVINTLAYRRNVCGEHIPNISCRVCKQGPETLMHILAACPVRAVSDFKYRHNAALRVLYYHLRHSYGIDKTPVLPFIPGDIESVVESDRGKIYWDFALSTTRPVSHNRPDIILFDHVDKIIYVIEFSAPAENNITSKEEDKRTKYRDLLFEIRQMHRDYRVELVVLIIGVLGGMRQNFVSEIARIPACKPRAEILASRMQKAVVLGSLRLLRRSNMDSNFR